MVIENGHVRQALVKVINEQMMNKLHEILKQYEKEVDMINEMFLKNKQSPPLSKGQPPIGGAILWERSLFERIKKTIVRFLTYEEMMDCEEGKAVKAHYLRIAKQMKAYEDDLYKNWRAATETNLPNLLRRNLLVKSQKVKGPFDFSAIYFRRTSIFVFLTSLDRSHLPMTVDLGV